MNSATCSISKNARHWRGILFGIAALLTGYNWLQLPTLSIDTDYTSVVMVWLLALGAYVVAICPPRAVISRDCKTWWRVHARVALAVAGITLIASVLRIWDIGKIPYVLAGDEAVFGMESLKVLGGAIRNPFIMGPLSRPTMHFFVTAPTLHWLGPTAAALRLPWAWLGILTVPVTFWLVKKLGGLYLALLATLLLALYHFHIHYSRLNLDNIADPLIGALAFLFFYRARSRESPMDWGWLGATWGAGMYLYQGARLIPFLVFGVACYVTLFERDRAREYLRGFGIALGAFLIVAAPMLQYALGNPGIFNGREDTVGILQNGWIDREAQVTGKGVVQILFDQFRYALFAFNLYPDASGFYGLEQPLLDPIFGVFFLLGLGYGTIRVITPNPDRRLAPMVAWWWCGMIFGGMLTLAPPSSHRLITLAVPVCFFIALGVVQVIGLARKAVTGLPSAALCAASIALFGTISLYTYFVDYAPRHLAGGGGAEVSTELGLTLQKDLDWQRIYFFGAPYIFWDFPTLSFLLPGADAVDLIDPIQIPPPANWLAPNKATLFIFLPGRIAEMTLVQKTFPHGKIQELWTPRDGSVIATIYKVPPSEK